MSLSISRLPQLAVIKSRSNSVDNEGTVGSTVSTIYSNVSCRRTRNKHYDSKEGSLKEVGFLAKSTHLIFFNLTHNSLALTIKIGYIITISSKDYYVEFVDDTPGGVENHHQQVYCSSKAVNV